MTADEPEEFIDRLHLTEEEIEALYRHTRRAPINRDEILSALVMARAYLKLTSQRAEVVSEDELEQEIRRLAERHAQQHPEPDENCSVCEMLKRGASPDKPKKVE